jgi:hypothetical protein
MTDDDRRPSDDEDTIDYLANEPSGNSGQLPDHIADASNMAIEVTTRPAHDIAGDHLARQRQVVASDRMRAALAPHPADKYLSDDEPEPGVSLADVRKFGDLRTAGTMRADLARPVPEFKGCIPVAQTIKMTGFERHGQVDILKHRAAWNATQGRHWPTKWDAWAHQFIEYMTSEQHHEWLSAVLGEANVPNLQWQTTCVIRIMSGEKRGAKGNGYGGAR